MVVLQYPDFHARDVENHASEDQAERDRLGGGLDGGPAL
jgi:hypothetical protein